MFTRDKCTLNTALSVPSASLPADYVEAVLIRAAATAALSDEVSRDTVRTAVYGPSVNDRATRVYDKVAALC